MAAENPPTAVLEKLKVDVDVDLSQHIDSLALTPHFVLAVSLLYMMASDGSIEDEESSQLQAAIGGHEKLLQFALRYVQLVKVEQFLQKAPEVLSQQDKLCILLNMCDSMLSDGRCEDAELALFEQWVAAFGVSRSGFDFFYKTIALKNDKSVLGPFALKDVTVMTPHLALAASLLYMMTSDGNIGATEIGQLEAVIGEFDGLQQVALRYVRAVKRGDFLLAAAPVLSEQQKLYILTNVCDSMLSDGNVAALEDKLFVSMLEAFGYSEKSFQTFYQVIEAKNIKPFDISQFKLSTLHNRMLSGDAQDGEVFDQVLQDGQDLQKVSAGAGPSQQQGLPAQLTQGKAMGGAIHRTMQDNIANVNQDFGGSDNMVKVERNANDQPNLQQVGASGASAHLQSLASDAGTAANVRHIGASASVENRQALASDQTQANTQNIDTDLYATYGAPVGVEKLSDNVQALPQDATTNNLQTLHSEASSASDALQIEQEVLADTLASLTPEVRMKNLFEDIDFLHRKLDDFEQKNKKMLEMARQAREAERRREALQALAALSNNQQNVGEDTATPNAAAIGVDAVQNNVQALPKEGAPSPVQHMAVDGVAENVQDLPLEGVTANTQNIALDGVAVNAQHMSREAVTVNVQDIPLNGVTDNVQAVSVHGLAHNVQEIPVDGVITNVQKLSSDKVLANRAKTPPAWVASLLGRISKADSTPARQKDAVAPTNTVHPNQDGSSGDVAGQIAILDDAAPSALASAHELQAKSARPRQRARGPHLGRAHATGVPFRVYVKATVTFVVLSCWASSISAVDAMRTRRFDGMLERLPVVTAQQTELPQAGLTQSD